jgi:hypothetical protein
MAACSVPPVGASEADEAKAVFDQLFADAVEKARATPDPMDDVAVAEKLLAAAADAAEQPALLVLLCGHAHALATRHPAGTPVAAQAMRLLAEKAPALKAQCLGRLVDLYQAEYVRGRGPQRQEAGQALLAALTEAADAQVEAREYAEAAALLRRAVGVAGAVAPDQRPALLERVKALADLEKVSRQIALYKGRLKEDPNNQPARNALVQTLLVDLDDPAKAAEFVTADCDPALQKYVPAAAKGVEAAPALAALELGDWYWDLAHAAATHPRPAMLLRARAYYERVLATHETEDLNRTKATLAVKRIGEALEKLGLAPGPAPVAVGPRPPVGPVGPIGPPPRPAPGMDPVTEAVGKTEFRIAAPAKPRKVLLYSHCNGFTHGGAIAAAKVAFPAIGTKTRAFACIVSDDLANFEADRIRQFDAILFNNTTGELFTGKAFDACARKPADQAEADATTERLRRNLMDFVKGGKGVWGNHAATDCSYKWKEWGDTIGGYFTGHPWNMEVGIKNDDPQSPINAAFAGQGFLVKDEIYQFNRGIYGRDKQRVLLSLDMTKTPNKGKREDQDYGISWIKTCGQGRVFYCALGHHQGIFTIPSILQHYVAGLQYAIGDLKADATPRPLPGKPAAGGASAE